MAHNLNYNANRNAYAFAAVKEKAWHGLGTIVENSMTSAEAIKLAHLDYEVRKVPNYAQVNPGLVIPHTGTVIEKEVLKLNPNSFSTVRMDTYDILGTVGSDYQIIQNLEAFDFFDDITKAKEAMFETAGALNNGDAIFISAKLPKYIKVVDDVVEQYLLFFNTHDGKRSLEVMFTPIRVVCNNTLTMARQTAKLKYRIRHTKSVKDRLSEASKILNIQNELMVESTEIYNAMAKLRLTEDATLRYIGKVFLTDEEFIQVDNGEDIGKVVSTRKLNILKDVQTYLYNGAGQNTEAAKGTLWGAYNAITGYYQNVYNFGSNSDKLTGLTNGDALNKNIKAYNLALDIINV